MLIRSALRSLLSIVATHVVVSHGSVAAAPARATLLETPPPATAAAAPECALYEMVRNTRPADWKGSSAQVDALVDELAQRQSAWPREALRGRWRLAYLQPGPGGAGVDRRIPFPELPWNDSYQKFGEATVENVGELLGPVVQVRVRGALREDDPTDLVAPKRFVAAIDSGGVCLGEADDAPCFPLPISGEGIFDGVYLDSRLRIGQNLNGGGARIVQLQHYPPPARAFAVDDGAPAAPQNLALDDLPPKAKQSYLQYLPSLQLAGDFYVFELRDLLETPGRWDLIAGLTESTDIGSAASVSRIEREFITPMRILSLAFPPDLGGDEMQAALNGFQRSMFTLAAQARRGQTTGNVAQPSDAQMKEVYGTWDAGRKQLNAFFIALNEATESSRLALIPADGVVGYPRSKRLYVQLQKDAAICRNRGGEALAGLWGQLMVYGTVPGVNPCGNAATAYFSQGQ